MRSEWVGWAANACILLVLFNCGLELYPGGERLQYPVRATVGDALTGLRLYYGKGKEERLYLQYANLFTGQPADLEFFRNFRGDLGWLAPLMIPEEPQGPLMPYRDLALEYPPLVLPAILLPRWLSATPVGYYTWFAAQMGLVCLGCLALTLWVGRKSGRFADQSLPHLLGLSCLALLALGHLWTTRLDALCSLFLVATLGAALLRRPGLCGLALGLACGVKLIPILLSGLLFYHWEQASQKRRFAAALVVTNVLIFLPPALWGRENFWAMLWMHQGRPVQIESTLGSLLMLKGWLLGGAEVFQSSGSFNVTGPAWFGSLSTLAALAGVVGVSLHYRRRGGDLVEAFLGLLTLLMVCSKVLSPQYFVWLWPAFLLLGRKEIQLHLILVFFLTQLVYPNLYGALREFQPLAVGLLLTRNLLLGLLSYRLLRGSR